MRPHLALLLGAAVLLTGATGLSARAHAQGRFTLEQVLSDPFPSGLAVFQAAADFLDRKLGR